VPRFLTWVAALAGVGALPPARALAQVSEAGEWDVKAAYLVNFARYAEWPVAELPNRAGAELRICIAGRDMFGDRLERLTADRRVANHPVRVDRPATPAAARRCHVVFITGDRRNEIEPWLADLHGYPILTVGDGSDFAETGGAIALLRVGETIKFMVNARALRESGVRVSSRVLQLAQRVLE